MTAANWTNLIIAVTGLVAALAGLLTAWRGHQVINTQVKPQQNANSRAIVKVAEETAPAGVAAEVRQIVNGGAASAVQHEPG